MLTDTHCHLDFPTFDPDRSEVLERAAEAGLTRLLVPGLTVDSSRRVIALAGTHPQLYAAVGVHPTEAGGWNADSIRLLQTLAVAPGSKVVAIGEIGLDYYRDLSPRHVQEKAFRDQITLAKKRGLPVVVHDRDAHTKVMQILKEEGVSKGVLHCFTGDFGIAKQAVDLGLYLSFTGAVTYSGSKAAEIIRKMPVDRLLIETDCPYLTPVPFRGKRNEPAYVRYVLEHVAGILGKPAEEMDALTEQNTRKCFGLPQA